MQGKLPGPKSALFLIVITFCFWERDGKISDHLLILHYLHSYPLGTLSPNVFLWLVVASSTAFKSSNSGTITTKGKKISLKIFHSHPTKKSSYIEKGCFYFKIENIHASNVTHLTGVPPASTHSVFLKQVLLPKQGMLSQH